MKTSMFRRIIYGLFVALLAIVMLVLLVAPKEQLSYSERRKLAKKPELSVGSWMDESYMDNIEKYFLDHFPLRDGLRKVKAWFSYEVIRQKANNNIYVVDGMAAKLEYPLNEESVVRAVEKINKLRNMYFADMDDSQIFYSIIPDKNYFMASKNGFPAMDYDRLVKIMNETMTGMSYIDIIPTLSLEDYYATDTHWRQEKILDTACKLLEKMGAVNEDYSNTFLSVESISPFYGVYCGQSALSLPDESLYFIQTQATKDAKVWSLENGELEGVYATSKVSGNNELTVSKNDKTVSMDQYDVFLNGPESLLKITNPYATSGKKLVIFRDSFGSSIVPLMIEDYNEILLIDTRYIKPELISDYIDMGDYQENTQVLFLYNTLLLNNSSMLK